VIDVALTPAALRPAERIVVVDALRATSTATRALAAGYARVIFADSFDSALQLRGPGRILAGEVDCIAPEGFDHGNSPIEAAVCGGRELVMTTTNGTRAIVDATRMSSSVILASMLNLAAVIDRLAESPEEVLILCAGTRGAPALEDTYVAGRIGAELYGPRTDAALIAEATARAYRSSLAALAAGSHAATLRAAGLGEDVADCACESVFELVPEASAVEGGLAVAAVTRTDAVFA
jgi:2-phosphosulfolactate phosphatase